MALIVETGAVVPGAESYLSVADADVYFTNRGNTVWSALTTAQKEQALRKATDYITSVYSSRWKGVRTDPVHQVLDWPRANVPKVGAYTPYYMDFHTIPQELKNAEAELAVRAAAAELQPDLEKDVVQETVGPISTTYDNNSPQAPRYPFVDGILRPYLTASGPMVNLIRS